MRVAAVWALLVALGQLADGLTYQLAHGHGQEMNPVAAGFIGVHGPVAILALKAAAAVAVGIVAWWSLRRGRRRSAINLIAFVAIVGYVGALSNLIGAL